MLTTSCPLPLLLFTCTWITSLQGDLLHVLSHPERVLRHTAGSISTTIVGALGLVGWPELVHWLLGSLASGKETDGPALDGALDSLSKVVEDHPHQVRYGSYAGRGQMRVTVVLFGAAVAVDAALAGVFFQGWRYGNSGCQFQVGMSALTTGIS
jgi:hypothetical protein